MAKELNGYELSRKWFDWCFENPDKISPNHTALYFFIIEHCNRLGWKKRFGLPTTMAKESIGIRSYNTYINTLNDLVSWGAIILIEKSKNQYSSNIIAISNFDKALDKALDKAFIKHDTKHLIKQVESTSESIDSIDKQLTINKETINKETIKPSESEFLDYCKLILKEKYDPLEFSLKAKFDSWINNNWRDGNDKKIKNWKSKINNTIPFLKPMYNGQKQSNTNDRKTNLDSLIELTERVLQQPFTLIDNNTGDSK